MTGTHAPSVLLTVSGTRRDTVPAVETLRDMARAHGVRAGFVIVPRGSGWRLGDDDATLELLHDSAARGHELLLGGLGEPADDFRRIGHHEARLRLTAAGRQLGALGLRPEVVAPVRWQVSAPALSAARDLGYRTAADAYEVHGLRDGTRWGVRVLALGEGFGAAPWWRRTVVTSARRLIDRRHDLRLSVAASHAGSGRVVEALDRVLGDAAAAGYRSPGYGGFRGCAGAVAA
ncbi:DUF2334 domain-containing protein [Corynebacterium bovis]|uniref:DUF2334 domain-containing protein n=1 Tax=Corynebacterium bovis TaxID=36808 RepID=UPI0024484A85|nr:DUF2334 domain-containing protein [Corynebacterium bovis]MDH2456562.1 DUF2334 domain-containing protein [Corynebacterium bovis]